MGGGVGVAPPPNVARRTGVLRTARAIAPLVGSTVPLDTRRDDMGLKQKLLFMWLKKRLIWIVGAVVVVAAIWYFALR